MYNLLLGTTDKMKNAIKMHVYQPDNLHGLNYNSFNEFDISH